MKRYFKKFFISTFGCAQNTADSEKIAAKCEAAGYRLAKKINEADLVIINSCMVRQMAEDRVYGLVRNLTQKESGIWNLESRKKLKNPDSKFKIQDSKIIVTGCMAGVAYADKTGKIMKRLQKRMPGVEIIPNLKFEIRNLKTNLNDKKQGNTETQKNVGDAEKNINNGAMEQPARNRLSEAMAGGSNNGYCLIPISNGCNNFCSYCVVPFARGREVSRPWEEIVQDCKRAKAAGYKKIMLLGQNVNSYGSDIIKESGIWNLESGKNQKNPDSKFKIQDSSVKPVMVKHLGRFRIPTLFPHLLSEVASFGFDEVNFMSSNPWDFSDELIDVIARNKNISRTIHLPVQSGDDEVLKRMNRWYTRNEYLKLVANLKFKIRNLKLSTDIIVGFPGETEKQFQNTVKLCRKVGFDKAYISLYSPRPLTAASKIYPDGVPHAEKKRRWEVLEKMINKKISY